MKATEVKELVNHVKNEKMVQLFTQMYGESRVEENAKRYEMVAEGFVKEFGDKEFEFSLLPEERRSAETIRITTMERFWPAAYIWTAWQPQRPTAPIR